MGNWQGKRYTANPDIRQMMKEYHVTQPMLAKECRLRINRLNEILKHDMSDELRIAIKDTIKQIGHKDEEKK